MLPLLTLAEAPSESSTTQEEMTAVEDDLGFIDEVTISSVKVAPSCHQ